MNVKSAFLGIVILSSSCASLNTPYQPPGDNEPSAELTVRNGSSVAATLWPFADAAACKQLLDVKSTFNMPSGATAVIRIPAGKDFSIGSIQFGAGVGTMCSADSTFHPEAGKRYTAVFLGDYTGCAIRIARQETSNGVTRDVAEPSFRPRKRVEPLVGTAYCK